MDNNEETCSPVQVSAKTYEGKNPCPRCGGWGWRLAGIGWSELLKKWEYYNKIICTTCGGSGKKILNENIL